VTASSDGSYERSRRRDRRPAERRKVVATQRAAGYERAIVSDIPGTTRDTIEESVVIEGVPVRLIDTAGIRSHADRLEAHGIARTERALDSATIALVVADGSKAPDSASSRLLERTQDRPCILFLNKADLGTDPAFATAWPGAIVGSVRNPETLERVRDAIATAGWKANALTRLCLTGRGSRVRGRLRRDCRARRACGALDASEPIDFVATELAHAFSQLGHVSEQVAAEEIGHRHLLPFLHRKVTHQLTRRSICNATRLSAHRGRAPTLSFARRSALFSPTGKYCNNSCVRSKWSAASRETGGCG